MLQILLAEDNLADVVLVRHALDGEGLDYKLNVVDDGEKAIEYLHRIGEEVACPDVMLLDLNLPKADGHEVLRTIRSLPNCALTPVIVVTSSSAARDQARAAELGANRYFRKPSELDEFMQLGKVVKEVLAA